jgi:MFS family permease
MSLMTEQTESSSPSKRTTLWLLGATVVLTAAALVVGISDNPPGIALLYGAALTLVLAGTHGWRSPQKFALLLVGALLGFFVLAVIHNFAEVGAHRIAQIPVLPLILTVISVVGFIAALIVCPMAALVGAVGCVANLKRR